MSSLPLWTQSVSASFEEWRRPGAVTLVCGPRQSALDLLRTLGEALSIEPVSLTEVALAEIPVESAQELMDRLADPNVLFDLETICWSPWLRLDPLRFLRQCARRHGVLALWPGSVTGRVVTFGAPDRRDYVNGNGEGLSVLRLVPTRFPDEVPFVIERISA